MKLELTEEIEKIWDIVKGDSIASSKIGKPAEATS